MSDGPRGSQRAKQRVLRRDAGDAGDLDRSVRDTIRLFVRVLARCGLEPAAVRKAVAAECASIPRVWIERARTAESESNVAGRVLTAWFTDPAYLDETGRPRWLSLRGASLSIERLSEDISPGSDPEQVLRYLQRLTGMRRKAGKYVPRDRVLDMKGTGGPDYFRSRRVLNHMLATIEHNMQPRAQRRFESFAENQQVPVRLAPAFIRGFRKRSKQFQVTADTELRRLELERRPGEKTQGLGIGIYFAEYTGPETRPRPLIGSRGSRKKRNAAR